MESAVSPISAEPHYKPEQLGKLWGVSAKTIRRMFEDEPGVLLYGQPGSSRRRKRILLRIPQSVAERVHERIRKD